MGKLQILKAMKTLVFLLLLFSFFLKAQNTHTDTVNIPRVVVTANGAQKISSQTIDSTFLKHTAQKDLGEVLALNSNVFVKSYGIGSQATVSLRGSGSSHTAVFWNGISLNSSMNGISDLALFPTLFIDNAVVDYGNRSLENGSGGLGGAISLNNKMHFKEQNEFMLQHQIGNFGFRNSTLSLVVGNEKWQSKSRVFYRTATNNFEYQDFGEEGFPTKEVENASLKQLSFMQSVSYRLKEQQTIEAHFWYYDSDRHLPPIITLNDIKERQKDESYRFLLKSKRYIKDGFYSLNMSVIKDELEYTNNRLENQSLSENTSYRNFAEIEKKWNKTKVYTRLNFDIEQAEHPSFSSSIQRERSSLYTSVSHNFSSKLAIEASARSEWIIQEDQFFLPLLSVSYQIHTSWKISSQLSKNLKYPSLNDLYWEFGGNEELKAEENQSAEFGIVYNKNWKDNLSIDWKGTAYYSEIDNYIQWQPTALGYWQAVNLKNVRIKGIESSLNIKQNQGKIKMQVSANYTYTQSLNQTKQHLHDDSKGKQLIYIPENQFNAQLRTSYKTYALFYQWQFVSARYTTTDNSDWQPDYQISNVGVSKRVEKDKHHINVEFSVLNLFDLEYHAIQWRPMANRNYQISISYQLK